MIGDIEKDTLTAEFSVLDPDFIGIERAPEVSTDDKLVREIVL